MKLNSLAIGIAILCIASGAGARQAPTCSDELGIANHGEHVLRDYVVGSEDQAFPYNGRSIGGALAGRGAALPGGPAAGGHFDAGVAPGASFCTDSRSPGFRFELS